MNPDRLALTRAIGKLTSGALRAEAAEEVVRALAAKEQNLIDEGYCALCFGEFDASYEVAHDSTCPWLRSVELVKEWDR